MLRKFLLIGVGLISNQVNAQATVIATGNDGLSRPTDLAFNPNAPDQLWTVNAGINGTVMLMNPGTDRQSVDKRVDNYASHFMSKVSSIAFGDDTFQGEMTFATCQDSRGNEDFMGPTLWPASLEIYARVNQNNGLLGSHLDMLHQSPLCMGIAHDHDNVYWVADGKNAQIVRYDFQNDHGPGHDDHSDGIIRRFPEATFKRVAAIPSHLFLDKATGWLYVADTGAGRVYRLDTHSGSFSGRLTASNEPLAEFSEWRGATIEVLAEGLAQPTGLTLADGQLFIANYVTGDIIVYDVANRTNVDTIHTGAPGISGLTRTPDGRLWFTNSIANTVSVLSRRALDANESQGTNKEIDALPELSQASPVTPPWTKTVRKTRTSFNQLSAQSLVRSAVGSELRSLELTCRNNSGRFSASSISTACSQLGSQYNCNGRAIARCYQPLLSE